MAFKRFCTSVDTHVVEQVPSFLELFAAVPISTPEHSTFAISLVAGLKIYFKRIVWDIHRIIKFKQVLEPFYSLFLGLTFLRFEHMRFKFNLFAKYLSCFSREFITRNLSTAVLVGIVAAISTAMFFWNTFIFFMQDLYCLNKLVIRFLVKVYYVAYSDNPMKYKKLCRTHLVVIACWHVIAPNWVVSGEGARSIRWVGLSPQHSLHDDLV